MQHLLLDANVLVAALCQDEDAATRQRALELISLEAQGLAFLYVPDFCVAEVLKALAKKCWQERLYGEPERAFSTLRESFLGRLMDPPRGSLYTYELSRRHLALSEPLYESAAAISYRKGQFPSALDLLLLAMGRDLASMHGEKFAIVTAERPICDIAARDEGLPPVLNIRERGLPRRWLAA